MTPEEEALLEQFYHNTQGDYDTRRRQFSIERQRNASLQGVAPQDFAEFIGKKMARESLQKEYVSFKFHHIAYFTRVNPKLPKDEKLIQKLV